MKEVNWIGKAFSHKISKRIMQKAHPTGSVQRNNMVSRRRR